MADHTELVIRPERSIEHLLNAWMDAKLNKSHSEKTQLAYVYTMTSFRNALAQYGLDLDSPTQDVAEIAQSWASRPHPNAREQVAVSKATYNQRLSIISSWYTYVLRMGYLHIENPMRRLERPKVEAYAHAEALEPQEVREALERIDRTAIEGKRDYAILSIALNTGRRVSEIAAMRWGHLKIRGAKVTVHFSRLKGEKEKSDDLKKETSQVLLEYLHEWYGSELGSLASNAPIWVALATNQHRGHALSARSMQRLCERHCGTSKFHALRSTFALTMERAGARVSEIQSKLGHESLATTGRYLAKLHSAENPYGDKMEEIYGIRALTEAEEE